MFLGKKTRLRFCPICDPRRARDAPPMLSVWTPVLMQAVVPQAAIDIRALAFDPRRYSVLDLVPAITPGRTGHLDAHCCCRVGSSEAPSGRGSALSSSAGCERVPNGRVSLALCMFAARSEHPRLIGKLRP